MIQMTCPHCNETLDIPDQYAGQAGACRKCGARIVVPAAANAGPASLPADLASALEASLSRENQRPRPVVATPGLGDTLQPLLKPAAILLGVAAIIAIVALAATQLPLSGFSKPAPEQITQQFMDALNTGGPEACRPYLTEASWQHFNQMHFALQQFENFTVGAATTSENSARVALNVTQFGHSMPNEVLLRHEAGQWRVHALRMLPAPGMSMTLDFENPEAILGELQNMMEGMDPAIMRAMEDAMRQQGGF
ncbi:MAG: hypothetical protein KF886_01570 [Candidatus Hydrogenedentes bacterium]|nr:hypothetical protein [Candidatus Hydrogenedentota bacterium]